MGKYTKEELLTQLNADPGDEPLEEVTGGRIDPGEPPSCHGLTKAGGAVMLIKRFNMPYICPTSRDIMIRVRRRSKTKKRDNCPGARFRK